MECSSGRGEAVNTLENGAGCLVRSAWCTCRLGKVGDASFAMRGVIALDERSSTQWCEKDDPEK